jgi:hypothetical protein
MIILFGCDFLNEEPKYIGVVADFSIQTNYLSVVTLQDSNKYTVRSSTRIRTGSCLYAFGKSTDMKYYVNLCPENTTKDGNVKKIPMEIQ